MLRPPNRFGVRCACASAKRRPHEPPCSPRPWSPRWGKRRLKGLRGSTRGGSSMTKWLPILVLTVAVVECTPSDACRIAADCPGRLVCANGHCTDPTVLGLCQIGADCPGTLACRSGHCVDDNAVDASMTDVGGGGGSGGGGGGGGSGGGGGTSPGCAKGTVCGLEYFSAPKAGSCGCAGHGYTMSCSACLSAILRERSCCGIQGGSLSCPTACPAIWSRCVPPVGTECSPGKCCPGPDFGSGIIDCVCR